MLDRRLTHSRSYENGIKKEKTLFGISEKFYLNTLYSVPAKTITMAIDFTTADGKIELNQKRLDTYNEGLEKVTGRISIISISYSLLSIYLMQLVRFAIIYQLENILFLTFLMLLVACLATSIYWTIKFLLPTRVAHLNEPKHFYKNIRKQYEEKGVPPDKINEKICATYLIELEKAVSNNFNAYQKKRQYFFRAFNFALIALIPYLICASIMLSTKGKEEAQKIEITNSAQLLNQIDSLISKKR